MEPLALLRELVRIPSVNPPGGESAVVDVLASYLSDAGVDVKVVTSPSGRPSLIGRLHGSDDRPALVLLSHSDVVPVEGAGWSRDPFGGDIADGFLWGRGSIDMKGIAVMHAAALADLARRGGRPARDVILAMVADEEAGGDEGAKFLLDEHPELVGFEAGRPAPEVLGEGAYGVTGVLPRPIVPIAAGEKTAVWFDVVTTGDPGHGAIPPRHQAAIAVARAVREIAGFGTPRVHPVMREHFGVLAGAAPVVTSALFRALASPAGGAASRVFASALRQAGPVGLLLSDSVTPTVLTAGYKSNVVPGEARASFDARLLPDTDIAAFVAELEERAREVGGRVENVTHKGHGPVSAKSPLFDILADESARLAPGAVPVITLTPGITDLRFFRARGAIAYGWTPLVLDPPLLGSIHGHDERIPIDGLHTAVAVMSSVVRRAAA